MSMCDVCCYAVFRDNNGHRQVCSECCSNIRDIANAHGQDETVQQVREAAQRHLDVWLTTETVMDVLTAWFSDVFESSLSGWKDQGVRTVRRDRDLQVCVLTISTRFVMGQQQNLFRKSQMAKSVYEPHQQLMLQRLDRCISQLSVQQLWAIVGSQIPMGTHGLILCKALVRGYPQLPADRSVIPMGYLGRSPGSQLPIDKVWVDNTHGHIVGGLMLMGAHGYRYPQPLIPP